MISITVPCPGSEFMVKWASRSRARAGLSDVNFIARHHEHTIVTAKAQKGIKRSPQHTGVFFSPEVQRKVFIITAEIAELRRILIIMEFCVIAASLLSR